MPNIKKILRFIVMSILVFLGFATIIGTGGSGGDPPINPDNTLPSATINSPEEGSSYLKGEYIIFSGSATDDEDGTLSGTSLIWTSSKNGRIGTGTNFTNNHLLSGSHIITLSATDVNGATAVNSISITVGTTLPIAVINEPADGDKFDVGEFIIFEGTGDDAEDGSLIGAALVWVSSMDGEIGTGRTFSTNSLSKGAHIITLTATDSDGLEVSDDIVISINSAAPNGLHHNP